MLVASWLAMLIIGWASDRWRSGLLIAPVVAAGTAVLCLITTNSPVFTAVERDLSFTVDSMALNFLAKLIYALLFYSAGYVGKCAVLRWRHKSAKQANSSGAMATKA